MSLELKVYDNGDHTCLVWLPSDQKSIPNCRGFSIKRTSKGEDTYLHGAAGFSDDDKCDPANPCSFPVQRYLWWDYSVKPGDIVQYSVIPVIGPSQAKLTLDSKNASPITPPLTITGQCTPHLSAFFNKGVVAAQWVSKALGNTPSKASILPLVQKPGTPLRNALSGLLRPQILSLLAESLKGKGKIYAALYELNDPELIPALEAFGADCNLILANGAFKPPTNDENAAVRATLKKTKMNVFDRMVTGAHFAHNKFVVFCDSSGKPRKVLTGSTNWTSSGLCTQANNGLVIDDPDVAKDFLDAWNRLKDAGSAYPKPLISGNSTSQSYKVDGCSITPWFAATSAAQDLAYARKLIDAAKEGILFLFFNPGSFQTDPNKWTLLQNILERHNPADANVDAGLYIRGVVNQTIAGLTAPSAAKEKTPNPVHDPTAPAPVTLFNGGGSTPPIPLGQSVMVPANVKSKFHTWNQELLGASMVDIHSKVIVLDPFGENPVVMTGSHNLGFKASTQNDDNLVIIEGNAPLAAAYAINIISIYQTYRWNSYVEAHRQDPKVWHGLVDNDAWQDGYLTGDHLAETKFWLGASGAAAAPEAVAAAAPEAVSAAPLAAHRKIRSASSKDSPAAKRAKTKTAGRS